MLDEISKALPNISTKDSSDINKLPPRNDIGIEKITRLVIKFLSINLCLMKYAELAETTIKLQVKEMIGIAR